MLETALGLWRGEPLACVEGTPLAENVSRELREERLAAVEAHLDAELALGRHTEVIGELRRLVSAHPDREHLWCRLMLALYRAGRQTEALETYTRARTWLLKHLGLEPGCELRNTQRRILEQDASLDLTASLTAAGARRVPDVQRPSPRSPRTEPSSPPLSPAC
jgi:DNA-binding SARP family transcriptional activator